MLLLGDCFANMGWRSHRLRKTLQTTEGMASTARRARSIATKKGSMMRSESGICSAEKSVGCIAKGPNWRKMVIGDAAIHASN